MEDIEDDGKKKCGHLYSFLFPGGNYGAGVVPNMQPEEMGLCYIPHYVFLSSAYYLGSGCPAPKQFALGQDTAAY
jgi:hypothetical protein